MPQYDYGSYDFVIIGAGSAGAVIASRLSEIRNWKILLLDAGKPGNNFTDIPSMFQYLVKNEYNWGFTTVPQRHCCLDSNGICFYHRGKALGGSSTINGMAYSRGNKLDYDKWGSAGNEGWFYEDVLPYFKKSENSVIFGNNEYHSTDGYLNVEQHKSLSKPISAFLKANEEMGIAIGDYNGKNELVAERTQYTTIRGKRMSTEKAFLYPAKNRKNLKVLTESYVTKVIIDKAINTVSGVMFSYENLKYFVKATKEVIISAGVFGSPQILMLSGIGPSEHLNKLGIPLIKNLDVGKTLNDQIMINLTFKSSFSKQYITTKSAIRDYLFGFGVLTAVPNAVLSFSNTNFSNASFPNIELLFDPNEAVEEINKDNYLRIASVLLHPKSVGSVYLKSSDPYDYPLIDINCLSDPDGEDISTLLKSVDFIVKLLNTNSLKYFNPQLIPNELCKRIHGIATKNYWICVLRQNVVSDLHGVSTCRMGPKPENGAVVNNKLKVYGIKNLRVADASIIPVTISGHTNAPAIMIGERAADFIKQEYQFT